MSPISGRLDKKCFARCFYFPLLRFYLSWKKELYNFAYNFEGVYELISIHKFCNSWIFFPASSISLRGSSSILHKTFPHVSRCVSSNLFRGKKRNAIFEIQYGDRLSWSVSLVARIAFSHLSREIEKRLDDMLQEGVLYYLSIICDHPRSSLVVSSPLSDLVA